jgi:FkbM family methyltransferase
MKSVILFFIHQFLKIPFCEKWFVWLLKNFPGLVLLHKLIPPNTSYSNTESRLCSRYGVNYHLYINDYQQWLLYFYSTLDSSFDVLKYINRGDTVIDIGSNIGQTALTIARKLNNTGKIFAFEPFPSTFTLLKSNLDLNPFTNIFIENIGLGAQEVEAEMTIVCQTNSGGNSVNSKIIEEGSTIKIKMTTLDSYFKEWSSIQPIHFIKLDVEGYEMNVLKGSLKILQQQKPKLFIEISDNLLRNQGSNAQELMIFLQNLHYTLYDTATNTKIISSTDLSPNCKDIYCEIL